MFQIATTHENSVNKNWSYAYKKEQAYSKRQFKIKLTPNFNILVHFYHHMNTNFPPTFELEVKNDKHYAIVGLVSMYLLKSGDNYS